MDQFPSLYQMDPLPKILSERFIKIMLPVKNPGTRCTLISINVPYAAEMTEDILVEIMRTGVVPDEWFCHIADFFVDVPEQTMRKFFNEHNIDLSVVQKVLDSSPVFVSSGAFENILQSRQ